MFGVDLGSLNGSLAVALLGALIGALAGFGLAVLLDDLKTPEIRIRREAAELVIDDFQLDKKLLSGVVDPQMLGVSPDIIKVRALCYRVPVTNRQKRILNTAAENCVAWLEIDDKPEHYQLGWVGELPVIGINVGDERSVNLCAWIPNVGYIFAPTENGYSANPRTIGMHGSTILGHLRVTSSNADRDRVRIMIRERQDARGLVITFDPNTNY